MLKHHPSSPETPDMPLVEGRGIGVRRDGKWLIHDVDLTVARGEIVSVIGPNGGGKTTLIKTVLGIIPPDAGAIARAPGIRLGYVPQRLSVDRNMPLTVARLMSLTRRAGGEAIRRALAETGVAHLVDRQVHELSGGELQRALISRALLGAPHLLVLDEPVQSVDFSGQVELYRLIAGVRDRLGCGVLLVSHDLHVVMRATDRILCLNGHICCTGVPQDVTRNPEYLRLFGDRAAATLAVYSHEHDHVHAPSGAVIGEQGRGHGDGCSGGHGEG